MDIETDIIATLDYIDPERWRHQRILTVLEDQVRSLRERLLPREGSAALARLVWRVAPTLSETEALQLARDYILGAGSGKLAAEGRILELFYAYIDKSERLSASRQFFERQKTIQEEEAEIQAKLAGLRWKGSGSLESQPLEQKLLELSIEKACAISPMGPEPYARAAEERARQGAACDAKRQEQAFEKLFDLFGPPPARPSPLPGARQAFVPRGTTGPAEPFWNPSAVIQELQELKRKLAAIGQVEPTLAPSPSSPAGTIPELAQIREHLETLRQDFSQIKRVPAAEGGTPGLSSDQVEAMVREALARASGPGGPLLPSQTILPAKKKDDPRGGVIEI